MASHENTPHSKKGFVSAGLGHSAVVLESGDLMSWGLSRQCQLGVDYLTEKDVKKGFVTAGHSFPDVWPCMIDPMNVVIQRGRCRRSATTSSPSGEWSPGPSSSSSGCSRSSGNT